MAFQVHSASVVGPGHLQSGLPNQDTVQVRNGRKQWVAVVSDGMGSKPHAALGSKMACRAAHQVIKESDFTISDRELVQNLYRRWLLLLGEINPRDAVATILIAWGCADGKCRLLQLGDGVALFTHGGTTRILDSRNQQAFLNETTGLGISKKMSDWSCAHTDLFKLGDHVILMTDGISDDIEDFDQFAPDLISSLTSKGSRYSKCWLKKQLTEWPTPFHTDDKTIAVVSRR
ncbi:PP2C family serine/threonine-protein phosphatase [Pelagibaculum spongiae]|uniref:PP2C family serine/threonine-protein phosphatase n=1 Tax=Pelagibaculum spongiae TaxID=2080658 RepID=UPI00131416C7|nr:PP2C family serine/threonine-protein phosphatase [Pelagibaculum spongiae]